MSDDSEQVILAKIQSRKEAWAKAPICFVIWEIGYKMIELALWIGVIALVAQCTCKGCIWK